MITFKKIIVDIIRENRIISIFLSLMLWFFHWCCWGATILFSLNCLSDGGNISKKDCSLYFYFCVLKKWVHSRIGQCVRSAVYTITLHNYIRLSWKFVHRIVSSISRSCSKMRMIRQEIAELSKKLSLLTRPSLRGSTGIFFQKKYFS